MDIYQELGEKIDAAIDEECAADIEDAILKIDGLLEGSCSEDPILLYYRANCFSALRKIIHKMDAATRDWNQPEFSQEILSLRRSIRSKGFLRLDSVRRCQVLTNLGNALSAVGRPIEAINAWDEALRIEPKFAMALANRAYGLLDYGAALYDTGHQGLFLMEAEKSLKNALKEDAIFESEYPNSVKDQFGTKLAELERHTEARRKFDVFDPYDYELGDSDEAVALNRWRLGNRLFLNPLNDLGSWPIAAHDVFHLPNHTYNIEERAVYPQYFDLLKQEYVAACVLLHESLGDLDTHPADQTLLTYDHADYSITSVQIEERKAAFRMAYSILDKCSVFVNAYFGLGQNPKSPRTSFRNIWYENDNKTLHRSLPEKNWRLRGLYAISLDLFDEHLSEVSSPLALKASDARNAAEHRFLSIHEFFKPEECEACIVRMTLEELDDLAMQGLKLARSAIMGLSLAVHYNEEYEKASSGDGEIMMQIVASPRERYVSATRGISAAGPRASRKISWWSRLKRRLPRGSLPR